jgi:hypothetical protein
MNFSHSFRVITCSIGLTIHRYSTVEKSQSIPEENSQNIKANAFGNKV